MKTCTICGHLQEDEKYCSECDVRFENNIDPKEFQLIESIAKVKERSKSYFSYLIRRLKAPSAEVAEASSGKYAITSICLLIFLIVTGIYGVQYGFIGEFSAYAPPFSQVFFYIGLLFSLIFGINVLAIFLTAQFFSKGRPIKQVICDIGNYFSVPLVIAGVGVLFAIIQSTVIAVLLIFISIVIAFGIIPIVIVFRTIDDSGQSIDCFYSFLLYFVFTLILTAILIVLIADSIIGETVHYF